VSGRFLLQQIRWRTRVRNRIRISGRWSKRGCLEPAVFSSCSGQIGADGDHQHFDRNTKREACDGGRRAFPRKDTGGTKESGTEPITGREAGSFPGSDGEYICCTELQDKYPVSKTLKRFGDFGKIPRFVVLLDGMPSARLFCPPRHLDQAGSSGRSAFTDEERVRIHWGVLQSMISPRERPRAIRVA